MRTLFRARTSAWVLVPLTMCLTIIPGFAASLDAEQDATAVFRPGRAVTYPAKLTEDKVTVAVKAYEREDDLRAAFGKTPLAQYGVLPVLVVIDNDSNKAVRLNLRVEFITGDNRRIVATPAADVPYLKNAKAPRAPGQPSPLPIPLPKKKNKLLSWEDHHVVALLQNLDLATDSPTSGTVRTPIGAQTPEEFFPFLAGGILHKTLDLYEGVLASQ